MNAGTGNNFSWHPGCVAIRSSVEYMASSVSFANRRQYTGRLHKKATIRRHFATAVFLFSITVLFTHAQSSIHHNVSSHQKTIPVLIVDGFSNHDWKQTTAVTKKILENSRLFKVSVTTIPTDSAKRALWQINFNDYAVVVQNTNNIHNTSLQWPRRMEKALEAYVKNGGGLYVLHSANNAFAHWAAYDTIIGLGWRPKNTGYALEIDSNKNIVRYPPGQGENTGHAERFDAVIQLLNRHPVNQGYPLKWKTANTEVYYYPRGPAENVTVLSYAYDSTGTRKNWPVEWVVSYGRGRVYSSSMGHLWKGETYPPAYRCRGFQTTLVRVVEWLATGKVTYPLPQDFPGEDMVSLAGEDGFTGGAGQAGKSASPLKTGLK
ncbi:ThuA domain-containing protein [Foetidibacter luteolus]|uniref:ThuA domain-containing protein n=1 Tax=Foetidibacter luteolus TaxID=2608880 RepID=UPI00129B7041|nr:ThuA domain-containing protein [Foetidibacter luteolus]